MGFTLLVVQSVVLGASAFAIGILPLSFTFSSVYNIRRQGKHRLNIRTEKHTDGLSTIGVGLLLGAALGGKCLSAKTAGDNQLNDLPVVIPEYGTYNPLTTCSVIHIV
jgi:hypothetical protein